MSASVSDRHDSAHDPICPTVRYPDDHCQCHLIAWAREDERDNCWSAVADLSATEFWEEVLVELPGGGLGRGMPTKWWVVKADALAAIEALKEKP